ncbi:MAG: hypothetical protein L3J51_00010 [Cocleimonas sp.]|nr:hypothetical protein [Cocleimonas sp.]
MPPQANKQERQIIKIFKSLDVANQEALLAFGEFLQTRESTSNYDNQPVDVVVSEPIDIPRPEEESVIKAIKRLSATYPMVDKETILHPISNLMTSHMIQGRKAPEVIDDLQALFLGEYESLKNE